MLVVIMLVVTIFMKSCSLAAAVIHSFDDSWYVLGHYPFRMWYFRVYCLRAQRISLLFFVSLLFQDISVSAHCRRMTNQVKSFFPAIGNQRFS